MPSPDFTIHEIDVERQFVSVTYHLDGTPEGDRLNNIHYLAVENWTLAGSILGALREYGARHYAADTADAESKKQSIAPLIGLRHSGE